jgi:hypothetical protein
MFFIVERGPGWTVTPNTPVNRSGGFGVLATVADKNVGHFTSPTFADSSRWPNPLYRLNYRDVTRRINQHFPPRSVSD